MGDTKFTPGPWERHDRLNGPGVSFCISRPVDKAHRHSVMGRTVLAVRHCDTPPSESAGNAALIVAAPDLFAAGTALSDFIAAAAIDDRGNPDPTSVRISVATLVEALAPLRVALAKARGEE